MGAVIAVPILAKIGTWASAAGGAAFVGMLALLLAFAVGPGLTFL